MRPASIGAASALRPQCQQSRTVFSKERSKSVYEYGAHRSDAEARIAEVPVVMVDGPVALCDGGAWGWDTNTRIHRGAPLSLGSRCWLTFFPPVCYD